MKILSQTPGKSLLSENFPPLTRDRAFLQESEYKTFSTSPLKSTYSTLNSNYQFILYFPLSAKEE